MITIYLVGISSHYEGEDIEIRYRIFDGDELVNKGSMYREYKKPAVIGLYSLITLLKEVKEYRDKEVTIVVNDRLLQELIEGKTKAKKEDIIKLLNIAKGKIQEFNKPFVIKDVSGDKLGLAKWDEILRA